MKKLLAIILCTAFLIATAFHIVSFYREWLYEDRWAWYDAGYDDAALRYPEAWKSSEDSNPA
ncbi:MAG: hypothetical protein J6Y20_07485 [Lachnospiraceae bacterium]|nr:hypothetical protein [Lachnospiraceae bacterium]